MKRRRSPLRWRAYGAAALACAGLLGGLTASAQIERRATPAQARHGPTRVWYRNVVLYPYDDAPAKVESLSGSLVPTKAGTTPNFDEVSSYGVRVEHAVVSMSPATMTVLMNRYILPASKGPIKRVTVSFAPDQILMKGTMVKAGLPVPFTATALARANAQGDLEISIVKMRAAGVIPKSLMHALGLNMERVAQPDNTGVFRIVGDTMIMPVVSMFPPPKFSGRIRSVRITPQQLTTVIGGAAGDTPSLGARSYIHFRGGMVHFAKLTMNDVDMTMVERAGGVLGFSPKNYYQQMQAGTTAPEPDFGMTSRMPSYAALNAGRSR